MSSQLIQHSLSCSWLITGYFMLLDQPFEKFQRLIALKLQRKFDSCSFLQPSNEVHFLPFPSNIDFLITKSDPAVICLQRFLYNTAEEVFCELDHISIIRVCTVKLA